MMLKLTCLLRRSQVCLTTPIKEPDAQIIRTIYDLYHRCGNLRATKDKVDKLGLRTAVRTLSSGKTKGGTQFSFGHVYHILTNPIYAGRIRHKTAVHPGLHEAIIKPDVWDLMQERLTARATIPRRRKGQSCGNGKKQASLLIGKVFDETGDRLTPSHTKTAKGHRLRYYVSRRLIQKPGKKDPAGWRLPAPELEALVANLVTGHLNVPEIMTSIVPEASTVELVKFSEQLSKLAPDNNVTPPEVFTLIERVKITPGKITIALCENAVAVFLGVVPERINSDIMSASAEFRFRKRGVETKLILANTAAHRDEVLLKNIARAHLYFAKIRAGQTFADIADGEGVSKSRIQKLIELAFLAPDIIRDVNEGNQPLGLTTEWLLRHAFPATWQNQRDLFRSL